MNFDNWKQSGIGGAGDDAKAITQSQHVLVVFKDVQTEEEGRRGEQE